MARRGNGPGWGGPAKGPGNRGAGPGRPKGEAWAGKASVADLLAEAGGREIAARRWLDILNDPSHPKHAEMVAKAAERLDGAPVQRTDVTSDGQRVGYVIAAPAEAASPEEWEAKHRSP